MPTMAELIAEAKAEVEPAQPPSMADLISQAKTEHATAPDPQYKPVALGAAQAFKSGLDQLGQTVMAGPALLEAGVRRFVGPDPSPDDITPLGVYMRLQRQQEEAQAAAQSYDTRPGIAGFAQETLDSAAGSLPAMAAPIAAGVATKVAPLASRGAQALARLKVSAGVAGLSSTGQSLQEDASPRGIADAVMQGLLEAAFMRLGGATGVEAIFKKHGETGVRNGMKAAIRGAAREAGPEIPEETLTSMTQDASDQVIRQNQAFDPQRNLRAGAIGGATGGVMGAGFNAKPVADAAADAATRTVAPAVLAGRLALGVPQMSGSDGMRVVGTSAEGRPIFEAVPAGPAPVAIRAIEQPDAPQTMPAAPDPSALAGLFANTPTPGPQAVVQATTVPEVPNAQIAPPPPPSVAPGPIPGAAPPAPGAAAAPQAPVAPQPAPGIDAREAAALQAFQAKLATLTPEQLAHPAVQQTIRDAPHDPLGSTGNMAQALEIAAKPRPAAAPAPTGQPESTPQPAAPKDEQRPLLAFQPGQRVRITKGKRQGTEATISSLKDGRPILRTDDGKTLGGTHGVTPDNMEAINASGPNQRPATPSPAPVAVGRAPVLEPATGGDGAAAQPEAGTAPGPGVGSAAGVGAAAQPAAVDAPVAAHTGAAPVAPPRAGTDAKEPPAEPTPAPAPAPDETIKQATERARTLVERAAAYRDGPWRRANMAKAQREAKAIVAAAKHNEQRRRDAPAPTDDAPVSESPEGRELRRLMRQSGLTPADEAPAAPAVPESGVNKQEHTLTIKYGGSELGLSIPRPIESVTSDEIDAAVNEAGFTARQEFQDAHRRAIRDAVREKRPVPANVLFDFPGYMRPDLDANQQDAAYDHAVGVFRATKSHQAGVDAMMAWDEKKAMATIAPPTLANDGITDFGEKIGGARKDTATATGPKPKKGKPTDGRPAWARRYEVGQIAASMNATDEGRWTVRDSKSTDWKGQARQVGSTFATKEEAEAAIPLAEASRTHRVQMISRNGDTKEYGIIRRVSDTKRKTVKRGFATEQEATEYLAAHPLEIIETETSFGEEVLAKPDTVKRVGAERRKGDVKPQDFMDAFGFRGVEFGNWNNQVERQEVMNHAFDAMHDLAEIAGIPARALSLNGDLALAFGARGHGLAGARAHYEPNKAVINLTKMKGAGALAHEWFHALDHYLARQDGKASAEMKADATGGRSFDVKSRSYMASDGTSGERSGIRAELREKFKALMETINRKAVTYVEDTAAAEAFVGKQRDALDKRMASLRTALAKERQYGAKKGAATAEQLARWDAAADALLSGDPVPVEWKVAATGKGKSISMKWANPHLDALEAVHKDVTGRSGRDGQDHHGAIDQIATEAKHYVQRVEMMKQANAGEEKVRKVPTTYLTDAKEADQGRSTDYWTDPTELGARAFSAFVEDSLKEKGGASAFLSFGSDNWRYKLVDLRPFPEGDERTAINKAIRQFLDTIKTEETPQGTMRLYGPERKLDGGLTEETAPDAADDDISSDATQPGKLNAPERSASRDRDRIKAAPIAPVAATEAGRITTSIGEALDTLRREFRERGVGDPQLAPGEAPKGVAGTFDEATGVATLYRANDLVGASHEIGHQIAWRYRFDAEDVPGETDFFAETGSPPPPNLIGSALRDHRAKEAWAEFAAAWMVNPEAAEAQAPRMTEIFKRNVPGPVQKALADFGRFGREFIGLPAAQRTQANIERIEALIDAGSFMHATASLFGIGEALLAARGERGAWLKLRAFMATMWKGTSAPLAPPGSTSGALSGAEITAYKDSIKRGAGGRWAAFRWMWQNVWFPAYTRYSTALEIRGREVLPDNDFRILNRLLAGTDGKVLEEAFGSGLRDSRNRRVVDEKTGEPLTFAKLLDPLSKAVDRDTGEVIGASPKAFMALLNKSLAYGVELRTAGRGGKLIAAANKDAMSFVSDLDAFIGGTADLGVLDIIEKRWADAGLNPAAGSQMRVIASRLTKMVGEKAGAPDAKSLRKFTDMYGERVREIAGEKAARLSGIGAGMTSDYRQAQKALIERESDPDKPAMDEFLRRYRRWAQHLVQYLTETGVFSAEQAKAMLEADAWTDPDTGETMDFYIDMHRIFDRDGSNIMPGRAFTGSTRAVRNPLANLMEATLNAIANGDRNRAMASLADAFRNRTTSGAVMDDVRDARLGEWGRQVPEEAVQDMRKTGQKVIAGRIPYGIKRDGVREYWTFDPWVEASIEAARRQGGDGNLLIRMWGVATRVMRAGITTFPSFMARNLSRDLQARFTVSESGKGLGLAEIFRGFGAVQTQGESEKVGAVRRVSGASYAGYNDGREQIGQALARHLDQLVHPGPGGKAARIISPMTLLRLAERVGEAGEAVNRNAELASAYAQAKERGYDDFNAQLYAADKSRGLIDFAEAGVYSRQLNRAILFINPAIQGLARFGRTWKLVAERAARGETIPEKAWLALTSRAAVTMGLMAAAAIALRALKDEKEEEKWRQQDPTVRDFHWHVPIDGFPDLAVARPYDFGFLLAGAERLADAVMAQQQGNQAQVDRAFEGYAKSAAGALLPINDVSSLLGGFSPIIEAGFNYDPFRGRHVIPTWEEGADLRLRDTDRASWLGKLIQGVTNQDARLADHVIEGYAGNWGRAATSVGKPADWWLGTVTGMFKTDPAGAARDVQWVYDEATRLRQGSSRPVKQMTALLKAARNGTSTTEREALAERARRYAASLRNAWEKNPPKVIVEK